MPGSLCYNGIHVGSRLDLCRGWRLRSASKNPDTEAQGEKKKKRLEGAPGGQYVIACSHLAAGAIRHRPCEPHREGQLETPAWCPLAITSCTTCVTALLSLMSPFSELLNLRLALGVLRTAPGLPRHSELNSSSCADPAGGQLSSSSKSQDTRGAFSKRLTLKHTRTRVHTHSHTPSEHLTHSGPCP